MVPRVPLGGSTPLWFVAVFTAAINLNLAVDEKWWKTDSERRGGRYLVYPTPGAFAPTKVQLIIGLGLPMEVDVSTIVGYVTKFNYVLPYNASYLTHLDDPTLPYDRSIESRASTDKPDEETTEETPTTKEAERIEGGSTTRWEIYRVIESALGDGSGLSGKGCLLRIICQLAEIPFDRAGLVAEIINVFLTPSTTREKYQVRGDQEYRSAEAAGRDNPGKCEYLFPECDRNLLDYFTETNL